MGQRGGPVGSSTEAAVVPGWRADEFMQFMTDFLSEGVVANIGGELAVSQHSGGANMSVDVAIGRALIEVTPTLLNTNRTHKAWFYNDDVEVVSVPTADPTNPRKDRIVAIFDMTIDPNGAASDFVTIELLEGTPAGSPSAPAVPADAISLAIIDVPAGDTTISTGQITDTRDYVDLLDDVLANAARADILASVSGAASIGIEDVAEVLDADNVEDALQELFASSGSSATHLLPELGNPSWMFPCATIATINGGSSIAFDAVTKGNSSSSASHTIAHTCTGSNRLLFVGVTTRTGTDTVTSITYAGVAMTRVDKQLDIGNAPDFSAYLYMLVAPASGANNVVVTLSGASVLDYSFVSYTGCSATQVATGNTNAASAATSFAITSTAINDASWLFLYATNDTGNYTGGADTTLRGSASNHQAADSAGANTRLLTMTSSSANHGGILATIRPYQIYPMMRVLDFDKTTFEQAEWQGFLPSSYTGGTVTAKVIWRTSEASGDVVWRIQCGGIGDNEPNTTVMGDAVSVTDGSNGAHDVNISAETDPMTVGGSSIAGEPFFVRIARDATNAADTMDADARLIGVVLTFA